MKKYIAIFAFILAISPTLAFAGSQVNIGADGSAQIVGAKVMQLAGRSFFMRLIWGDAFVRFLVKTGPDTKFYRATGEVTDLSEIHEGDYLDIAGTLESGSNSLQVIATTIKNSSVQKEKTSFSGTVTGVDLNLRQFSLNTKTNGLITVQTSTSTIFTKLNRTLDLEHIKVGDKIIKTSGDYDIPTKTLTASAVVTYIDPNYYKPKNFEGTLVSVSGTTLPTQLQVAIDGTTFTVNLTGTSLVLAKNRSSALLNRFVNGDKVRLYGIIKEVDNPIIDAEIIRNLAL